MNISPTAAAGILEHAEIHVSVSDGGITPLQEIHRTTDWRLLPFHVLVCYRNVRGRVRQRELDYVAEDGEAYLIARNVRHKLTWVEGNDPVSVWCHFNVTLLHSIDFFSFFEIPPLFRPPLSTQLTVLCEELVQTFSLPLTPLRLLRRETLAFELVSRIVSGCAEKRSAAAMLTALGTLSPALEYMRRHPTDGFDLAEAAARVNLSKSRFSAVFKQVLGMPPGAYWRNLRLSFACEELYRRDVSAKELAEQFNFYDEFHFSRMFQRKYGLTPAALRKKLRSGERW